VARNREEITKAIAEKILTIMGRENGKHLNSQAKRLKSRRMPRIQLI